jgi:hypothetical protein
MTHVGRRIIPRLQATLSLDRACNELCVDATHTIERDLGPGTGDREAADST